jgi:hypothetical protein
MGVFYHLLSSIWRIVIHFVKFPCILIHFHPFHIHLSSTFHHFKHSKYERFKFIRPSKDIVVHNIWWFGCSIGEWELRRPLRMQPKKASIEYGCSRLPALASGWGHGPETRDQSWARNPLAAVSAPFGCTGKVTGKLITKSGWPAAEVNLTGWEVCPWMRSLPIRSTCHFHPDGCSTRFTE